MGITASVSVPVLTVFIQGLLSFFSPCVLPLVPVYISWFAGGAKSTDESGNIIYPRGKTMLNTLFFVLGVSVTFFILGFGFTAIGQIFTGARVWIARIGGVIMILFGLYQLGVFKPSAAIETERKLPFDISKFAMGPLAAFLLGFTFSFSWTPCIGPTLGSVLLMAGSSGTAAQGFALIAVYTAGFVIPFLAAGLFTGTLLNFFKKHVGVVRYTVKIGAALLIIMGVMTLTGIMDNVTSYFASLGVAPAENAASQSASADVNAQSKAQAASEDTLDDNAVSPERPVIPAPDFTLTDQYGVTYTLADLAGKTVFLNFWATWCPNCVTEMADIQKLYEEYGENEGDVLVLGAAAPNLGSEGDEAAIKAFLDARGITYPTLMDDGAGLFRAYGITAYPTTFMISPDGTLFGFIRGALPYEVMQDIIAQTVDAAAESAAASENSAASSAAASSSSAASSDTASGAALPS